ncbi:MAG: hypothetical protein ACKO0Z_15740 [Betaproteobacteria bacterium]
MNETVRIERTALRCACAVYQYGFKEANVAMMVELVDASIEQLKTKYPEAQFIKWDSERYVYITKFDPTRTPALKDLHIKQVTANLDAVTVTYGKA